jgi:hypothetical protein
MRGTQQQFPQERVIFGVPVAEALGTEMATEIIPFLRS